jgi:hypothetical protein
MAFLVPNQESIRKFIFKLFDTDDNGLICPQDIQKFFLYFGGTCATLEKDLYEVI